MANDQDEFVAHRANALALVALTSRKDVLVNPTEIDNGLDMIAQIVVADRRQSRVMGVEVRGTSRPLPSEEAASKFLKGVIEPEARKFYYFPVLALAFTVDDDSGYYAWLIEPEVPGDGDVKLSIRHQFECRRLNKPALNKIVDQVNDWYDCFHKIAVKGA